MGRTAVLIGRSRAAIGVAVLGVVLCSATAPDHAGDAGGHGTEIPKTFRVRAVKLSKAPSDPEVYDHLRYVHALGFNTVWVYGHQAGTWTQERAPDGPALDPAFLEVVRWTREHGMEVLVSVNPVAATGGTFRFGNGADVRRLHEFVRLLKRRAGIRHFVLSFDDQPTELHEMNDLLHFGRSAAPAHLALAHKMNRWIPRSGSFWLCASAYSDAHLGDGAGPYSRSFLERLPSLPARVGIVWTGPGVVSPTIERSDLAASRRRLGARPLLLYDNYPVNDDSREIGLGLVLGPLRNRGPDLYLEADAYLSCPMTQTGASRLPLATVADWLADPASYDADASWQRALDRIAGDDARAATALRVQAAEWGGWIGGRNYHPVWTDNVIGAASRLDDPAWVASWSWTRGRYPERMRDLEGLADTLFRDDLLRVMERRLAIARAIPLVVEFRARAGAGRSDAAEVLAHIRTLRADPAFGRDTVRTLDLFLTAADVPFQDPRPAVSPQQPATRGPRAEDPPCP